MANRINKVPGPGLLAFFFLMFLATAGPPATAKAPSGQYYRVPFCPETTGQPGSLWIISHPRVDSLIEHRRRMNEENPGIDGYRVQLTFSYQRKEARELEADFLEKYPGVETYLVYEQPYFKLRAGNFRTFIEAQAFYYELLDDFSNVFIVPSQIELPQLKSY